MRPTSLLRIAAWSALALFASAGAAFAGGDLPADLPPYGADKPLELPEITSHTLGNGLLVWIVPRPGIPKVTATLAVRGGTAVDGDGLEGISEVFADVLTEGTVRRTSQQLAEELQAVGGGVRSRASDDAVYLTVDGLAHGAGVLIDVLADVATSASFPGHEVELARTNAIQGLEARQGTPEFAVDKTFYAAIYPDHPYRTYAPERAALEAITPELLRREFERRMRPERALLVIAGALDPEAVGAAVKTAFGGWVAEGEAALLPGAAPTAAERRILLIDRPDSVQSEIRVGRPTLKVTDPDYYPMVVANTIFGGSFSSRLVQNIREDKGYTYSPRARNQVRAQGGALQLRAPVRNDVTAAALLEIFYELDRMGATVPEDEELERAQRYLAGIFLLRNQTQGSVVFTLANNWVNGLLPDALAEYVPKVKAVTGGQVRDVGRKYYASRQQVVVIGGDVAEVRPAVEQFGDVTVVAP